MTINFLPKHVLCATVDAYYFLWAPLASAWHNYKVAICQDPMPLDIKVQNIADKTLNTTPNDQPSYLEMKAAHFFTHIGAGMLLTVPLLNILPFTILVIKIKEDLIPDVYTETILTKINVDQDEKVSNSPPLPNKKKSPQKTEVYPSIEKSQSTSKMSPRVQDKLKLFQPSEKDSLIRSDSAPIVRDKESLKKQKELENEVTNNYFILFPENSSEPILRKAQHEINPTNEERAIVNDLILAFPGFNKEPKFINAKENLKTLRQYLIDQLGESEGKFWIRQTFSHDVQVQTKDNPFELVRKGIFTCKHENFLGLIQTFSFTTFKGTITITTK